MTYDANPELESFSRGCLTSLCLTEHVVASMHQFLAGPRRSAWRGLVSPHNSLEFMSEGLAGFPSRAS